VPKKSAVAARPANGFVALWNKVPLQTAHWTLDWLLLAVPVALLARYVFHAPALFIFAAAALAIVPLASTLGEATEQLSEHVGERIGGLLNATMGNATEMIIAIFAIHAGHEEIVKASLSGSIIGNILLVFGLSAFIGGLGREKQAFSRNAMGINTTMLFISAVALIAPAIYELSQYGELRAHTDVVEHLSLWTSAVLIALYVLSIVFTFRTPERRGDHPRLKPTVSKAFATVSLVLATLLIAWLSDVLVEQLEAAKHMLGWSNVFLGVVVVATVGNAAEHATAVIMARRNKMDLAMAIAAGSSAQIAMFVAPVLVFIGWAIRKPLSLIFSPLEIVGIALSVGVVHMVTADGETNWFEGAALLAVYAILAIAFFHVPA
jgi:Ca2+:H+ antiporter